VGFFKPVVRYADDGRRKTAIPPQRHQCYTKIPDQLQAKKNKAKFNLIGEMKRSRNSSENAIE
jgi:nicotinamide riboside kinase